MNYFSLFVIQTQEKKTGFLRLDDPFLLYFIYTYLNIRKNKNHVSNSVSKKNPAS